MSLFSPPSIPSSLAVFLLNRCQRWVKSSPEGLPAAYWFIINEIRATVCRGGFGPSVGLTLACQEDRRQERSKRTDGDRRMLDHRPKKTMTEPKDWTYSLFTSLSCFKTCFLELLSNLKTWTGLSLVHSSKSQHPQNHLTGTKVHGWEWLADWLDSKPFWKCWPSWETQSQRDHNGGSQVIEIIWTQCPTRVITRSCVEH